MYDILRRPIISEKAAKLSESNGVAFEVAPNATKEDVVRAVQAIYNIKPTKVNIVVVKGKVKSFRGRGNGAQRTVKKHMYLCRRMRSWIYRQTYSKTNSASAENPKDNGC